MIQERLRVGLFLGLTLAPGAGAVERTCSSATTLDALVTCIRAQMPGSGSNGFVIPNSTQQADWRWVIRQMLQGPCNFTLLALPVVRVGERPNLHDPGEARRVYRVYIDNPSVMIFW